MTLPLREIERRIVLGVLARHGGNKMATAQTLGIATKTLYNKLTCYGVHPYRSRATRYSTVGSQST